MPKKELLESTGTILWSLYCWEFLAADVYFCCLTLTRLKQLN